MTNHRAIRRRLDKNPGKPLSSGFADFSSNSRKNDKNAG
jgi:hypothetical protein